MTHMLPHSPAEISESSQISSHRLFLNESSQVLPFGAGGRGASNLNGSARASRAHLGGSGASGGGGLPRWGPGGAAET